MADNWMDERERDERALRRADYVGRWPERGVRQYQDEGRSFASRDERDGAYQGDAYQGDGGYEGGRDRVFGEGGRGSGPALSGGHAEGRGWQNPNYGGVSPAMRRGEYEAQRPRFTRQDDTRGGGGFYGDDDRERIYREEYGQGGVEHGDTPPGYQAGYSPTRAAYPRQGGRSGYGPGADGRTVSGGTGGYDYERGYGDGGRGQERGDPRGQGFEDVGRNAGDFLHRAGEKVAAWFAGGGEGRGYQPDFDHSSRSHRGKGPQGYKRSDERISEDAHERLTDDAWLDASDIAVSVSAGEVTLSGTVQSREAKHRAERIVEHLNGVTHVQNNLRQAKGNFLTSAGSGYGDSAAEAQMRTDDAVANGTGGSGAGQSTAGRKN
jgi:osmotically-inducible protein OsmY